MEELKSRCAGDLARLSRRAETLPRSLAATVCRASTVVALACDRLDLYGLGGERVDTLRRDALRAARSAVSSRGREVQGRALEAVVAALTELGERYLFGPPPDVSDEDN